MRTNGARGDGYLPLDLLRVESGLAVPLSRQLYEQLRDLVLSRALPALTRLPSSRMLARQLGVSRNTVVNAINQLVTEGYVTVAERSNAVVAALPDARPPHDCMKLDEPWSHRGLALTRGGLHGSPLPGRPSLHPGVPDIRHFPFADWRRLMARRLTRGADDIMAQNYVNGHTGLREATADYLRVSRGVRCQPSDIVITSGALAAFDVVSRALLDPGDTVWMEEPGFYGARSVFLAAGATVMPLPVSHAGWDIAQVPDPPPKIIFVTPQCQSPMGLTMRMEDRLSLLRTAEALGAWVIEDDFDGEYRFDGSPVPALQGSDNAQRTIYVGTFSKVLFPALRVGYVVMPPGMADGLLHALFLTGQTPPMLVQAVLADFISNGLFARHLRRTRRLYSERRLRFVEACSELVGNMLEAVPGQAGMQIPCIFRQNLSDEAAAREGRSLGISFTPLSRFHNSGTAQSGAVLGFAALDPGEAQRELRLLRRVLALPQVRA